MEYFRKNESTQVQCSQILSNSFPIHSTVALVDLGLLCSSLTAIQV